MRRSHAAALAVALSLGCRAPTEAPLKQIRPQTVVLLATPKMIADFVDPEASVAAFLEHYQPLISQANETVVIFAVGNSDHILTYRGMNYWKDSAEWARFTDGKPVSNRVLDYGQVAAIVSAFKRRAAAMGDTIRVYDQVDPGNEFTENPFKYSRHPECMDATWESFDIRGLLRSDGYIYASEPRGTPTNLLCGTFLVNQVSQYVGDLGFDGMLYGNQFGTRGRWLAGNGPGYTTAEATAIEGFLQYSRQAYGPRGLIWFDSYNNVNVERQTFSFPPDGYRYFDFIIAAGFCVITDPAKYLDDLKSKLAIPNRPRVLATLDYVDPWYSYNSMTAYPVESSRLEQVAIDYRDQVDGIVLFANDERGALVPAPIIQSFASRFFPKAVHTR